MSEDGEAPYCDKCGRDCAAGASFNVISLTSVHVWFKKGFWASFGQDAVRARMGRMFWTAMAAEPPYDFGLDFLSAALQRRGFVCLGTPWRWYLDCRPKLEADMADWF